MPILTEKSFSLSTNRDHLRGLRSMKKKRLDEHKAITRHAPNSTKNFAGRVG